MGDPIENDKAFRCLKALFELRGDGEIRVSKEDGWRLRFNGCGEVYHGDTLQALALSAGEAILKPLVESERARRREEAEKPPNLPPPNSVQGYCVTCGQTTTFGPEATPIRLSKRICVECMKRDLAKV